VPFSLSSEPQPEKVTAKRMKRKQMIYFFIKYPFQISGVISKTKICNLTCEN
jgi:hypothetical protein